MENSFHKIFAIAEGLSQIQSLRRDKAISDVLDIIKNKVLKQETIESLIEEIIDIDWFMNMEFTFQILLKYYSKINPKSAYEYFDFYQRNNKVHWEDIEIE